MILNVRGIDRLKELYRVTKFMLLSMLEAVGGVSHDFVNMIPNVKSSIEA